MSAPVNKADAERLRELERIVERARQSDGLALFEIGAALFEIRENELFRSVYPDWEWRDYVRERWSISKAYANRLVGHYRIRHQLASLGIVVPTSERQTRPLIGFDEETAVAVWRRAVESAPTGGLSGRHVETVARQFRDGAHRAFSQRPGQLEVSDASRFPSPEKLAESKPEAVEHRRVVCQFRQIESEANRFQDLLRRAALPSGQALLTLALNEWLDRNLPGERHFQFTEEYVKTRELARTQRRAEGSEKTSSPEVDAPAPRPRENSMPSDTANEAE